MGAYNTKKCVAVRGSVLQSVAECEHVCGARGCLLHEEVCAMRGSVLQCVAHFEHVRGTRVYVATHEGDYSNVRHVVYQV